MAQPRPVAANTGTPPVQPIAQQPRPAGGAPAAGTNSTPGTPRTVPIQGQGITGVTLVKDQAATAQVRAIPLLFPLGFQKSQNPKVTTNPFDFASGLISFFSSKH